MRKRNYSVTTKIEWYTTIAEIISEDIYEFASAFFPESAPSRTGNSIQLQPCPICGHKDCCTVSEENLIHCFSCGWKGTYINAYLEYATGVKRLTDAQAIKNLGDFYDIPYPFELSQEDTEKRRHHSRLQEIMRLAEDFYYNKLINEGESANYKGTTISPYKYLTNIRRRSPKTIEDFKIGYSKDFPELKKALLDADFTDDEIKEAKIRIPEGLICYFYHHPSTREIHRINTKNPFGVKAMYKDSSDGQWKESEDILKGWSAGDKVPYFSPGFSFKKPVVIIEGENDTQAIYEQGFGNSSAIGGNPSQESLKPFELCEKEIFIMTDNDEKGREYIELLNDTFPDKTVGVLKYDENYNDPDEYYRDSPNPVSVNELIECAEYLKTDKYKISHNGSTWLIKDREKSLEFIIKGRQRGNQLVGQANLYDKTGALKARADDTALVKCKSGGMSPFSYYLQDKIDMHFNAGFESLTFMQLAAKYKYSSRRNDIVSTLAKHLYEAEESGKTDEMVSALKKEFKSIEDTDKVIDTILIEYNNLKNESVTKDSRIIPKMKLSQYYNLLNNDAYFYFTYRKDDGDAKRAIPYLLKNDGNLIRLDLLKRKDQQCLLLVDNKYELPFEVPIAMIDVMNCSLQDNLVEDFRENKIPDSELDPKCLVKEIEGWIKRFYYTKDEDVYKVLALWCYGTYFYIMFSQYPYLYINGEKGSGKTILDNVLTMFAFNAKLLVDTSESSLFRTAAIEGGTIILDEQESLTSRSSSIQTSLGAILKSGYSSSAYVSRFNLEKGTNDLFDPYCPKVISNIFGLEDIILDRCLPINTYRVTVSKDVVIEDPKYYIENDQTAYKDITSKCCFSALKYFQDLNAIYRDRENLFQSDNARLSQILTPIMAIAKFVDREEVAEKSKSAGPNEIIRGEYENSFLNYYQTTIQFYKRDAEENTSEGIIKRVVVSVAGELTGRIPPGLREYTIMQGRKYQDPILYDLKEGWFEINTVHFKCFIEECLPGEQVYTRIIPRWLKTAFMFNSEDIKRKVINLDNDELVKEFKGVRRPKVNTYRFRFEDYIDSDFLENKASTPKSKKEKIEESNVF